MEIVAGDASPARGCRRTWAVRPGPLPRCGHRPLRPDAPAHELWCPDAAWGLRLPGQTGPGSSQPGVAHLLDWILQLASSRARTPPRASAYVDRAAQAAPSLGAPAFSTRSGSLRALVPACRLGLRLVQSMARSRLSARARRLGRWLLALREGTRRSLTWALPQVRAGYSRRLPALAWLPQGHLGSFSALSSCTPPRSLASRTQGGNPSLVHQRSTSTLRSLAGFGQNAAAARDKSPRAAHALFFILLVAIRCTASLGKKT